jgi:hypothetical protein
VCSTTSKGRSLTRDTIRRDFVLANEPRLGA